MPVSPSAQNPFFGLRILQPNEDPNLPPKRILNYKDGTELVYVPSGPFWMGGAPEYEERKNCPRHLVQLDGYYVAVFPVTNKQYRRFIRETGHRIPDGRYWMPFNEFPDPGWSLVWKEPGAMAGFEEHPVVCVSWEDSVAYATWAGLRLPTEAEWEKAATGPEGLWYPWGNEWDEERCRHPYDPAKQGTENVRAYPNGSSEYGCEQMSGNIGEWCQDWYDFYTYEEGARTNPAGPDEGTDRVVRGDGGRWELLPYGLRAATRSWAEPSLCDGFLGFRLARSFP